MCLGVTQAELYILTSSYHSTTAFQDAIDQFVQAEMPEYEASAALARVRLVDTVDQVRARLGACGAPRRRGASPRGLASVLHLTARFVATDRLASSVQVRGCVCAAVQGRGLGPAPRGSHEHGLANHRCVVCCCWVPHAAREACHAPFSSTHRGAHSRRYLSHQLEWPHGVHDARQLVPAALQLNGADSRRCGRAWCETASCALPTR